MTDVIRRKQVYVTALKRSEESARFGDVILVVEQPFHRN